MLISSLKHFPVSHFVRRFSYPAINKTEKQRLSFEDPESIYKGKKTWELGRAYLVFSLCGIKMLMENNQTMMKVGKMILGDKIFGKLMKLTFYGHFVGGENEEDLEPLIKEMKELGVDSIMDYSVEEDIDRVKGVMGNGSHKKNECREFFYQGEEACDKNTEMFLKSIDMVADSTDGGGFSALKMTALGRPEILLRMSEIEEAKQFYIRIMEKVGMRTDGDRYKTFQVHNLESGKMEPLLTGDDGGSLMELQEEQFTNMVARLHRVFSYAKSRKVRVMVDAEQSFYQPAINSLTLEMMKMYNTEEVVVFNTYQCYLRDAFSSIVHDLEQARRQNFYFGVKLVRGAYMDQERELAMALGYEDPINVDYEATTNTYYRVLSKCLETIRDIKEAGEDPKKVQVMVASHNEDTVRFTMEKMEELGIQQVEKTVSFAQLLGMSDHVTFPLGKAGYMVYKYVPYGPVMEVLPYLSRRVTENGSMLTNLGLEKKILGREIWRRIKAGM